MAKKTLSIAEQIVDLEADLEGMSAHDIKLMSDNDLLDMDYFLLCFFL